MLFIRRWWAGLVNRKGSCMDEEIQEAAQELVNFFNEDMSLSPRATVEEAITGVERWVRAFNRDAEALDKYHERWTKLAKLIAARDELPK